MAKEKGFYTETHLEVTILDGGFPVGKNTHQTFLSRAADFMILSMSDYQSVRDSNAQPVAVMAIQQIPPAVFLSFRIFLLDRSLKEKYGRRKALLLQQESLLVRVVILRYRITLGCKRGC